MPLLDTAVKRCCVWLGDLVAIISTDLTNSPSKTEVTTRFFATQCYVDVYED
jgi:hypothetical protein